jgi:hypothetical protein
MKSNYRILKTFSEKVKSFIQSTMFWRGRKKGMIHTRNIQFKDIRAVFFPMNFYEKYHYLGSIPHRENGKLFKAILPIILTMDYEAKPKWCPRWFLRLLHLFGNDNSIIRVRNRTLHNLQVKLTKGIMLMDWKTKWNDYDLRISAYAPEHINELTNAIQSSFHSRGRQEELVEQIKKLDVNASIIWGNISRLEKQLAELENKTTLVESDDGSIVCDVVKCCRIGPIIDEKYCPECGNKIVRN